MPAANCAMPPNVIANRPTTPMSDQWPTQPAWMSATIAVATEKPARPSADGAAIGWRNTRGRAKPSRQASSSRSATPAEACSLRSSIVLIRHRPLPISLHVPSYSVALSGARLPGRETSGKAATAMYIATRLHGCADRKEDGDGALQAARVVAGAPAAPRGRSARARQGGAVAALEGTRAAHRRGGARRPLHLPLLRRGLRAARLRQRGGRHPYRGRPRQPDLTRPAVPQGTGLEELRPEPAARVQGQVPAAVR